MEGYINSGFAHSTNNFQLKQQKHKAQNTKADDIEKHVDSLETDYEVDLNDDSFLSDLEKDSERGYQEEPAPVLHGYCDRSFEKNILTFTNGDTGPVTENQSSHNSDNVTDNRQGSYLLNPLPCYINVRYTKRTGVTSIVVQIAYKCLT